MAERDGDVFELDHLAIACANLAEGADMVERALGVPLGPIGQHPHFGTHNRLLSLGGSEYLEVIAIDPQAPPPGRARWFDLDRFHGPPRLANWILRCNDIEAAVQRLGPAVGAPVALSRGSYRWRMAVPEDGILPFDNLHPALIQWQSDHPGPALPERGCRLRELRICHPEAERLHRRLLLADPRLRFETGAPALAALLDTPSGPCRIG